MFEYLGKTIPFLFSDLVEFDESGTLPKKKPEPPKNLAHLPPELRGPLQEQGKYELLHG